MLTEEQWLARNKGKQPSGDVHAMRKKGDDNGSDGKNAARADPARPRSFLINVASVLSSLTLDASPCA